MQHRQPGATGLRAGRLHDPQPVLVLAGGARCVEPDLRAIRLERHDRARAELDRLLDRPVHPLGARQALGQRDRQRALGLARQALTEQQHAALRVGLGDRRGKDAAGTVEGLHALAGPQPQHANQVMRAALAERHPVAGGAGPGVAVEEDAGHLGPVCLDPGFGALARAAQPTSLRKKLGSANSARCTSPLKYCRSPIPRSASRRSTASGSIASGSSASEAQAIPQKAP